MPAYVPPALRGAAAGASSDLPKLPDRIWKVQLSWTTGGPFSVESCPQTLLPTEGEPGKVTVRTFELPSDVSIGELRELFAWFAKQSVAASGEHPQGDPRCAMAFPPSLSKEQRKMMHGLAEAHRLPTFSRGLGDERRLAVHGPAYASTPEMAEDVAAVAERKRAPQRLRQRAKQVWHWCQADGGALWSVSQGEIEEALLAAPDESKLPAAVKDLLERREHGAALINAIRAGDTASALAVLSAHPRAAWIRDDSGEQQQGGKGAHGRGGQGQHGQGGSGGGHGEGEGADGTMGYYPLHLAALAGLAEVVEAIAAQPGAVEQRDKNYATPLKVAKKAGQAAMVELLLKHGAKDYEVNQAAHKTAAVPVPVPSGGGRRGSHSHAASPHVGSPAHGSPHASGSAGAGSYMAAHSHGRQARTSSDAGGPGRHGPSSLGKNQHSHMHGHGQGTPGRRSIDEQHGGQHGHHNNHHQQQQQQHAGGGSGAKGAQDPVFNPFALLASVDSGSGGNGGGGRSRRNSSSSTGKPPRPPAGGDGGGSDSDTAAAGRAAGGGGGRAGRGSSAHRCMLPPIQSGEVPDDVAMAALASVGMSAAPLLATAQEAGEEACSGDDDHGSGDDGAGGDAPRRRKTRRGRRGRGASRRNSVATTDEAAAAAIAAAANGAAASMPAAVRALRGSGSGAVVGSAPTAGSGANLLNAYMAGRGKGGKGNSSAGGSAHGGDSDSGSDSGSDDNGSRTRRGGQPARARRHERRRQARASASGGGDGGEGRDRRQSGGGAGGNRGRSSLDYASFHKGGHGGSHGGGGGGGAGHHGGHYQVHGAHHGHADDATSWRRDVPSPARGGAAGAVPAGEGDRPLPPARPPHVRRMSAGPGAPLTAPEGRDAPGSPFHHWGAGQPAAAREHVAVGPTAGSGFGFGRGRGRGAALAGPGAPGSPLPAPPGAAAGAAAAPAPAGAPPAAPGSVPLPSA